MGRFMSDRPNHNALSLFIDIVERSILSDPQFPNRRHVQPGRDQPDQLFSVTCLAIRFVPQLYFDLIKDSGSLSRPNRPKIISNAVRVGDFVHNITRSSRRSRSQDLRPHRDSTSIRPKPSDRGYRTNIPTFSKSARYSVTAAAGTGP